MKEPEIVCRCEEVAREEIIKAIKKGDLSIDAIKRRTRAGMGLCQGRTCRRLISGILAAESGLQVEEAKVGTYRPPIGPVPLNILASEDKEK